MQKGNLTVLYGGSTAKIMGGILAGLVLLGILSRGLMPGAPKTEIQCRSSLRQIALALNFYASDNGGWYPAMDPDTRQLANDAGLPAGSVVAFRDTDGVYKATGLGLLFAGGYLKRTGASVLYCPGVRRGDEEWLAAFTEDADERFWREMKALPPDGDGVGELPGQPDVILCSYVLRWNPENPAGATHSDIGWPRAGRALVSDLFVFDGPQIGPAHKSVWNVLFPDGSVGTLQDTEGQVTEACSGVNAEKIEEVVDEVVFGGLFDPVYYRD